MRVLLADPSWIGANADAATFLSAHGIESRHMKAPGVHVKAMVVDGTSAYAGSINLSWTSLTKNREIGLIVTDAPVLATMGATFEADFMSAQDF